MRSRWVCETGVRMRVEAARIRYSSLLKLSLGRSTSALVSTTCAQGSGLCCGVVKLGACRCTSARWLQFVALVRLLAGRCGFVEQGLSI